MANRPFPYFYALVPCMLIVLIMSGCAQKKTPSHVPRGKASRQQPADPKAQQRYYDLGLQYYSKENYDEARKAFQQALDAAPGTRLGVKAQENIRKIDQILRTLEEMEKK
jgi:Tfp pilus assembly protein PilF